MTAGRCGRAPIASRAAAKRRNGVFEATRPLRPFPPGRRAGMIGGMASAAT